MTVCAPNAAPAWDRPVFIITTGRSGSTLLLRYLNCAEGLVVWGEHAGVMREISMAYRRLIRDDTTGFVEAARPWVGDLLAKRAVVCPSDKMTIEWVNSFDVATVRSAFRQLILSLFTVGLPETTRWGFKEIHYECREMNMLRQLFAAPRFLILLRDPAAILKSKLKAFARGNSAAMTAHVAETHSFFKSAVAEAEAGADDVLFVRYEDLTARPEAQISRISRFIETPFVADSVQAIIAERAGRTAPTAVKDTSDLATRLGLTAYAADIEAIVALDQQLTLAMPPQPAEALAA